MDNLTQILSRAGLHAIQTDYFEDSGVECISGCNQLTHQHFVIRSVKDEYLHLMILPPTPEETFVRSLQEICTAYFEHEPICQYATSDSILHIQWRAVSIDPFLRSLINFGGEFASVNHESINLFGDRNREQYIDKEMRRLNLEAIEAQSSCSGVYGKDPQTLNVARIKHAKQVGLFLEYTLIDAIADEAKLTPPPVDPEMVELLGETLVEAAQDLRMIGYELQLDYLIYEICGRLGIPTSEPTRDHRLRYNTELFADWLEFYHRHLATCCSTPEEYTKLINAYRDGADLSEYEPKNPWVRPY